ncbi:G-protein coupled receptor 4-like [Micropterus dolomieu]|uniref:G-protein coupled receptor 4-like n=1 Tax=Micropterus dolomieu TaxID=147949 RepID=UPI001E8EF1C5|nr:G-protein coupled receptor 4-like [Micropterus dolomieu]
MEGLYINSSSQDQSYDYNDTTADQNYSNIISNYQNNNELDELYFIRDVVTYIVVAVGLPLTLVAIYALYSMPSLKLLSLKMCGSYLRFLLDEKVRNGSECSCWAEQDDRFGRRWTSQHVSNCLLTFTNVFLQVRSDQVAPIYVINLLITDILQLCYMIVKVAPNVCGTISEMFIYIYYSALLASVFFMVCIALERYLVIAHPLWYRCRRTIKTSVVVCVLVWVLTPPFLVISWFYSVNPNILAVLLLLPFPLLIFSLVGTLKALSASISVPSDGKRRIVGILVLVLLIYTLLFLPSIILILHRKYVPTLNSLSLIFLRLSPLADLCLYVLMRKGFIDKLLASVCCCRMDSNDISSSSV